MGDMTPDEVGRIAKGLTRAQIDVLRSSIRDPRRHGPYHMYRTRSNSLQSVLAMARRGMIERSEYGDGWEFFERGRQALGGMMILTPLGLAVRAIIAGESK
jgi:hypothetical protein